MESKQRLYFNPKSINRTDSQSASGFMPLEEIRGKPRNEVRHLTEDCESRNAKSGTVSLFYARPSLLHSPQPAREHHPQSWLVISFLYCVQYSLLLSSQS